MLAPANAPAPRGYRRREPQQTILYEVVRRHGQSMFAAVRARHPLGHGLPAFVEHEFLRYLDCGILDRGFVRVHCGDCGHDRLVAFSCKGRGLCPSCTTRRMHDTAAHLVDRVLPDVPYRQWVLSLPRPLRFLVAHRPQLLRPILQIFLRCVFAWQRRKARHAGVADGRPGAITFVQRFGSALNLNIHFHTLVPDGVFVRKSDGAVTFVRIAPPSGDEILAITCKICRRATALVAKVEGSVGDDCDDASAQLYAEAVAPPRSGGQPIVQRLLSRRCALVDGFSLHANVHIGQGRTTGLELLCRYGARPPLALSRLSKLPDGRILYRFKRALPDGTDHLALGPVDFLARLAALVPPPRIHLVRYHGVFAPNAKDRPEVVPFPPPGEPLLESPETAPSRLRDRRLDWAALLRRVFAVDVMQCPLCDGRMQIIAFIADSILARRILDHLGLPSAHPAPEPARPPPELHDPGCDDSIS